MKFNLNLRKRPEESEATSDYLQQDRFAGVQQSTVANSGHMDPRTPKRVLDELEETSSPIGYTENKLTRAEGNDSPTRPSAKKRFKAPASRQPKITDYKAAKSSQLLTSTPNPKESTQTEDPAETVFEPKEPEGPPTSEALLDRGSEILAEHAKQQRQKGFRKRGHIAFTQYTYDPGYGIHYSNYVEHLYSGSPVEHYTQVLIWCLHSRVKLLQNQEDINTKDQATAKALNSLIYELARGNKLSMNWTRQTYRSLPDSERAPNPINERNSRQIHLLRQFLKDLQSENQEWMDLLEQSEPMESPVKKKTLTKTVELPKVGINEGLNSICSKIAQLEVDVGDVETSIAKYLAQFKPPLGFLRMHDRARSQDA